MIFIIMNYQKIYNQIIERAKSEDRKKYEGVYYESHHIIPKCLGGDGDVKQWKKHPNIILLTPREHFVCHWLLHNLYPDNKQLMMAFWMMCSIKNDKQKRYIPSSRIIEYSKSKMIEDKKSKVGYWKDKKLSDETKNKIRASKKGIKIHSEENKKKLSERCLGNKYTLGKKHTSETKKMISDANKKNYEMNPLRKITQSIKMKNRSQKKIKCPYCEVEGGNTMSRWHFENCKYKK
jgi:hypothetical protein